MTVKFVLHATIESVDYGIAMRNFRMSDKDILQKSMGRNPPPQSKESANVGKAPPPPPPPKK
jgi:hypothetical protein